METVQFTLRLPKFLDDALNEVVVQSTKQSGIQHTKTGVIIALCCKALDDAQPAKKAKRAK